MKIINENGDPDFEFTSALEKLLGISEDEVGDLIEKLEMDQINDLITACQNDDAEAAKKAIGADTEEVEGEPELSDHELMAKKLFSPKDKAKAEKTTKARILKKSETELGEDTDAGHSFNIGDPCAVDGEEGTVKIASAPGDTVGVMINGELKMVDKKNVHKLEEGVLGMTGMPGLKPNSDLQRIRELAGLGAADEGSFDEPEPAEFPNQPPMTPPLEAPVHDDMGTEEMPMDVPHMDMDEPSMDAPMDGGMDAPMEPDMGAPAELPALPAPAPDMGMPSPGSALEDAAALDQAISEIENLIPNVKISEYKTLVARLKALVSMAESAGKAALTEGQKGLAAKVVTPHKAHQAPFSKPVVVAKPKSEDRINPKTSADPKPFMKKPVDSKADSQDDPDVTRKTLMDYVREADEGMETIGMDRNSALKAIQARMGLNTSPQDANKTFDAMFAAGKVTQQNGAFKMPAMSDEDFHTAMSQTGPSTTPTGGASNNTTPNDDQGNGNPGSQTTNPGANVQGSSNSAYQGR